MCYELILSTTSSDDLSAFNDEAIRFDNSQPERASLAQLEYPNKWYVGSRTGCSCSFRHLYEPAQGFAAPEDWFEEDREDIEATLKFIRVVRSLIARGERVDCIDLWAGNEASATPLARKDVDLSDVRDEEFRFFENHHFNFVRGE